MNSSAVVADASAVIALLVDEPFAGFDPERLYHASISAVNLSEVFSRLLEIGMPESTAEAAIAKLDLQTVPFDEPQARTTARLRSATRHAGLSLGDRACLSLGLMLGRSVVTANRAWSSLDLDLEIVLVH